jgi:hypothetical protein
MKRVVALAVIIVFVLSFVSCSGAVNSGIDAEVFMLEYRQKVLTFSEALSESLIESDYQENFELFMAMSEVALTELERGEDEKKYKTFYMGTGDINIKFTVDKKGELVQFKINSGLVLEEEKGAEKIVILPLLFMMGVELILPDEYDNIFENTRKMNTDLYEPEKSMSEVYGDYNIFYRGSYTELIDMWTRHYSISHKDMALY